MAKKAEARPVAETSKWMADTRFLPHPFLSIIRSQLWDESDVSELGGCFFFFGRGHDNSWWNIGGTCSWHTYPEEEVEGEEETLNDRADMIARAATSVRDSSNIHLVVMVIPLATVHVVTPRGIVRVHWKSPPPVNKQHNHNQLHSGAYTVWGIDYTLSNVILVHEKFTSFH